MTVAVAGFACAKPAPSPTAPASTATAAAAASGAADGELRIAADTVVATWSGGTMTYGELAEARAGEFRKLRNKYLQDLNELEQRHIEEIVVGKLMEEAAKKAGKDEESFVRGLAGEPTVSDEEMAKFYDENVKQSGQPFEPIKDRIRGFLVQNKQKEAVRGKIDELKAAASMKVTLPAPALDVAKFDLSGRPFKGKADAKVTVVAFSDFQCPYCSKATPAVEALIAAYPNDVKVYFMHFPLSFHERAAPAAVASECANQQGKFWSMHDKLFENQGGLTDENFLAYAEATGLDLPKFKTCQADPATRELVDDDMAQGTAAGVDGTPSFFINGVKYPRGVPTVEALEPHVRGS